MISAFNAGGQTETWPMAIWNDVRFGVTPKINALATMMIGVTIVLLLVAGVILRRSRPQAVDEGEPIGATLGLG